MSSCICLNFSTFWRFESLSWAASGSVGRLVRQGGGLFNNSTPVIGYHSATVYSSDNMFDSSKKKHWKNYHNRPDSWIIPTKTKQLQILFAENDKSFLCCNYNDLGSENETMFNHAAGCLSFNERDKSSVSGEKDAGLNNKFVDVSWQAGSAWGVHLSWSVFSCVCAARNLSRWPN